MFNRLIFDTDLIYFLDRTSRNKVSMLLLNGSGHLISEQGNFISRDPNQLDVLTYFPKSKFKRIMVDHNNPALGLSTEPWSEPGRVPIRVGRFAKKFISEESIKSYKVTDKDIEDFVNLYKSYFIRNPENLKIVEGKEILKWYLEENYALINGDMRYGTLWNSCMRYCDRNKYMDLYTKNKNIKMLILLNDTGKLIGRSLLWDNVQDKNGNPYKVMDRIYTIYDHDVNFFKDWAKENGYIHKAEQSAKTEKYFIVDGKQVKLYLSVQLEEWKIRYYPYLDTFKFFDFYKGILHNNDMSNFQYILTQSNGNLEPDEDGDTEDEELMFEED